MVRKETISKVYLKIVIFRENKKAPFGEPQCIWNTWKFEHGADAATA